MELEVGELVSYIHDATRLGVVTGIHTTNKGTPGLCEVVIVVDPSYPDAVGETRYTTQQYWTKVALPLRPLDEAITHCVDEYEEEIDLHKTYGES